MPISYLRKDGLVEQLKNDCGMICAVDFGTGQEPIDDMEPMWVSHDWKHEYFALDVGPSFCCHLIFGQSPHSTRARETKPRLITRHQMPPVVFSRRFEIGNH
jgi:hypothetical protein